MLRTFVINNYLIKQFLKLTLNITFFFFCLGFIVNLFEELNLFKDHDVGINIPIILSLLFVPSLIYNVFPFIILLTGIWFFLGLKRSDEIIALKISGMSNFSVILVPGILSIILGIFFITLINPITAVLVKKYESIKGNYEKDHDYLAAVTENGIWIKEKKIDKNYIIRAAKLKNNYLFDLTIYEFDKLNNFLFRIESESADISNLKWELGKSKVLDKNGKNVLDDGNNITYESLFDVKKSDLPKNMDEAISLFETNDELNQIFSHKFIKTIAAIRRVEYQAYLKVISSWEREYLLLNV